MKIKKYLPLLVSTIILLVSFSVMQNNYTGRFKDINDNYDKDISINLDGKINTAKLAEIIERNGYADKKEDAQFIAQVLSNKFKGDTLPDAVTDLNKRLMQVPASHIESAGTPFFKDKLKDLCVSLGQTAETDSLYKVGVPVTVNVGTGNESISVAVKQEKPKEEVGFFDKMMRKTRIPVEGVLVRLDRHMVDSTMKAASEPLAYAMTDADGMAVFGGLDPQSSYSVIPIKRGFEFGSAKGTTQGSLAKAVEDDATEYGFTMQPMSVRLFTPQTVQRMKEDGTVTVRKPEAFLDSLQFWFTSFLAVSLLLVVVGNTGRRRIDNGMVALMMLIGGFSFMLMYGINNPLTDRLLGMDSATGIVIGMALAIVLQAVDFSRLYEDDYRMYKFKCRIPFDIPAYWCAGCNMVSYPKFKGFSYLIGAILLTASLFVIGQSVGGMLVNISIGTLKFQPSEIAKYMIVFFMAAWFCRNSQTIIRYSEEGASNVNATSGQIAKMFFRKIWHMMPALIGFAVLLLIYLKLGDMGPALVVAMTFIILYSLVKSRTLPGVTGVQYNLFNCDMAWLIYGILSYVAVLVVGNWFSIMGVVAVLWFVAWLFIGMSRKRICESALLFNVIITLFVFGPGWFEGTSVGDRLGDRVEMCVNTWGDMTNKDNPVPGVNTQVAEGQWSLAAGGWLGQGIGHGAQGSTPAGTTDLIMQSIGEQMGFVGVLCIVMLLSLLLWKALLTGFRSNHHFTLFLCAGIAIVTGLQFIIISLGSTGIIPLTGITVPFFSYGRVSLLLNMLAIGMVLSVSSHNRRAAQQASYMKAYTSPILCTCLTYTAILVFIIGVFFRYQVIEREEIMLRPALVYNKDGAAIVKYNPRIEKLASRMKPGDIYDRNGILIATSFADKLDKDKKVYDKYGVQTDFRKVQDRYYPFGEHLFFMLGDYNNKLYFSSVDQNSPRGYMAEARHLAELRGYDNVLRDENGEGEKVTLKSDKYKPGRFLPAESEQKDTKYQLRQYSSLLPYLKAGYDSDRIKRFNERNETLMDFGQIKPVDLRLTIDAKLQTRLQNELAEYKPSSSLYAHLQRTSVVVMDASNGDLLASAVWPLPDYDRLEEESQIAIVTGKHYYDDKDRKKGEWTAYTDMDLGMAYPTAPGSTAKVMSALAGLRRMSETGDNIENYNYNVYDKEVIHREEKEINGKKVSLPAEPIGKNISMSRAIENSSNNYFINLVNDLNLYEELAHVYESGGIWINGSPAYKVHYDEHDKYSDWSKRVTDVAADMTKKYKDYIDQRVAWNDKTHKKMKGYEMRSWDWAWGQGTLDATPLGMARIAATVVNGGQMPVTRYLMTDDKDSIKIADKDKVEPLKDAMVDEAHKLTRDGKSRRFATWPNLGGKTGTPMRVLYSKPPNKNAKLADDGWYICFVEDAIIKTFDEKDGLVSDTTALAIAVRIERCGGSGDAKTMAQYLVMKALAAEGYVPAASN